MGTEPVAQLFPTRVRVEVLAQHEVLRDLLQRTLDETTCCLREREGRSDRLISLAHDVSRRFRTHLSFEERSLVPILAAEEVWGQERAAALLEEHARQRGELDTIVEGIETGWDLERVAFTLRSLVVDLLRDMEEEEEGTLRHHLLNEPVIDHRAKADSLPPHRR
jgi:hypothetical protein